MSVCTAEDNFCGWAGENAVVYGSMETGIAVPVGARKAVIAVTIPGDGWGQGLAGPAGSGVEITFAGATRVESIDSSMPYHHGGFFKYEYGAQIINTFDIEGQNSSTLKIAIFGAARLDFHSCVCLDHHSVITTGVSSRCFRIRSRSAFRSVPSGSRSNRDRDNGDAVSGRLSCC